MTKIAYLFAGQGSQYVGMGKDLYESFPEARRVFDTADKALGFSLSELCFSGPREGLTITANCQPAILTVSIAAWEAFKKVEGRRSKVEGGQAPDSGYAAGLSLGEYSALVASGALAFEDAVRLVRKRGEFMEEEARKKKGAMLSIFGLDLAAVRELAAATKTEVANVNCPGQTVISGGLEEIGRAEARAGESGARMSIRLDVSGAFHSSLMRGASEKLAAELAGIAIHKPRMAFVANVTGTPVSEPAEIRDNLIRQVASVVLWEDSMRYMTARGVTEFYEFGPGKVLRGLMRRIDSSAQVITVEKKEDIEKLVG